MAQQVDVRGRVGPATGQDGVEDQMRLDRTLALVVTEGHGFLYESAARQNCFSLVLPATTTGVAAGNITGAAAAASTQFALWNPQTSGKNLSIIKVGVGVISGTPGAGPMFYNTLTTIPTIASVGLAQNSYVGGAASSAKYVASAAGVVLTGGGALTALRIANFSSTATVQATVGLVNAIELIYGGIVLPPGTGFVPCWGAAGTSLLNGYSVTWEEVPV